MKQISVIFLALATLAAFAFYQQRIMDFILKHAGMEEEQKNQIVGIAVLSDAKKNVSVKRSAANSWTAAQINEPLALLDSVSTGLESNAMVKFDLGYLINIGEKSLVVIEDPIGGAVNIIEVSFDQGFLQAQSEQNIAYDSTLRIKSNNTVTEVRGVTDLSMSVDKVTKKAQIWVKKGTAKVKNSKGVVITIKENQNKVVSIEPEEPAPQLGPPPPMPTEMEIAQEQTKIVKEKKVERRLNRNTIIKTVAHQRKKIDTCYERKRKISTGKSLAVKITIQNTGLVSNAGVVRSNLDDVSVENCVMFWIKAIKFPVFDGKPISETVSIAFQ